MTRSDEGFGVFGYADEDWDGIPDELEVGEMTEGLTEEATEDWGNDGLWTD